MKTKIVLSSILLLTMGLQSFAAGEKTIENLKAAFKGESTASAKYAAFAEQAKKEGLLNIAAMFAATSRAEKIHADNHKTVLTAMGQTADPVKPEITAKTTKDNLAEGISGESYEITTMYPGFIATAKTENSTDASKSFRWAMDTEKKHLALYQNALTALNANNAATLAKSYSICPKCGNTFNASKPEAFCSFCGTKSDKYILFDK